MAPPVTAKASSTDTLAEASDANVREKREIATLTITVLTTGILSSKLWNLYLPFGERIYLSNPYTIAAVVATINSMFGIPGTIVDDKLNSDAFKRACVYTG